MLNYPHHLVLQTEHRGLSWARCIFIIPALVSWKQGLEFKTSLYYRRTRSHFSQMGEWGDYSHTGVQKSVSQADKTVRP